MTELKSVTKIVKAILEQDAQTRNSDSYLYLKVIEHMDVVFGTQVRFLPLDVFLKHMGDLSIPNFETVRRTRQKVQSAYPELRACEKVEEYRAINEEKYRAYATAKGGL
jgi:hypothetical protein